MCSAAGTSRSAPSAAVSASVRTARCRSRLLIDAPAAPAGVPITLRESGSHASRIAEEFALCSTLATSRRAVHDDRASAGSNGGRGQLSADEEPGPLVCVSFVGTHESLRTKFHALRRGRARPAFLVEGARRPEDILEDSEVQSAPAPPPRNSQANLDGRFAHLGAEPLP